MTVNLFKNKVLFIVGKSAALLKAALILVKPSYFPLL